MTTLDELFANITPETETGSQVSDEAMPNKTAGQSSGSISKSERIRRYLNENPEARNRDIVGALAGFGVSAADVGNVKSQMKKRSAGQKRQRQKSKDIAKPAVVVAKTAPQTPDKTPALQDVNSGLGLDIIEAGVDFIRRAGGMNEAQYVLNLIRQIRSM